jgi:hypothetical protein
MRHLNMAFADAADISWMGYYGFVSQYNRSLSGILRFTALKFSKYCPFQNISKFASCFEFLKPPEKKHKKYVKRRLRKVESGVGVRKSWKF